MMKFAITFLCILLSSCGIKKEFVNEYNRNAHNLTDFSNIEDNESITQDLAHIYSKQCIKADINIKNVTIDVFAKFLSKLYNANINTSDSGGILISMQLKDVCIEEVLSQLTNLYDIGYVKNEYGYSIYSPELRTKIFSLSYHNFERSGFSSTSINSSSFQNSSDITSSINKTVSTIETKSEDKFWNNIEHTIQMIIMDDAKAKFHQVSIYKDHGLIAVKAYPRALKHVEEFLQTISNNHLKQVVIEAKILEIELNDEFSSGIDWKLLNGLTLKSNSAVKSDAGLISTVISGQIHSSVGKKRDHFNGLIDVLSSQGKVSVLSSPRISALNNQRAIIKFGHDSYYITNVSNISFANPATQTPNTVKSGFDLDPFFSGIALDTTPSIISNDEVILHIHPIITRVKDENKAIELDGKKSDIPLAKIQTREADTVVKSRSGDVIVIGGLMQNYSEFEESGPPVKLKGLKALLAPFYAKKNNSKKSELIILLKPTIMNYGPVFDTRSNDHILSE